MPDYLKLAQEAFEASSTFMDANWRPDWDYSIKAFRNEHASGSKYLSPEYASRSRLVSPKTRSIIRKNEAAGAVALFSNMDVVNLEPGNPDEMLSVASTAAMKAVLEYRLTKTIPTFEIAMGGIQDAQTQGVVCSYQYWEHEVRNGKKIKDRPCIELRPIENIRLDGGASWLDPVNSSPYFCDIIPMYVCNVRGMMDKKDDKTGSPKWKTYEDSVILKARPDIIDSTRKARNGNQQDPIDESTGIKDFDIVWVLRWFMKDSQGDDHVYYTLGTEELLTDAVPIDEVYHHGKRPYEMGYAVLETHKVMKTSVPTLVRPIQLESTDLRNQRLDNVKFVLNKRWIVARGRQVDVQSLVRNVPGGVTLATDPKNDVQESNWPDVTSSAFVEHDRLSAEFDDLAGNFSPSTKVANNAVNDTLGGSKMAMQSAGMMTDYMLRTIIETWWEKVLRQLVLLEATYENDETVLAACAKKAKLFPKFGISQITDFMLEQEMTLTVNVGFGSSDPNAQLHKLVAGTRSIMEIAGMAPPGFNLAEYSKEVYSKLGYRDGTRFWPEQQDPRLAKAMEMIKQLQGALEGKQMETEANAQLEQAKIQSNERIKAAQLQVDQARIGGDLQIRQSELAVEVEKLRLEELKINIEVYIAQQEAAFKQSENETDRQIGLAKLEQEKTKLSGLAMKISGDIQKSALELETAQNEHQNEAKIGEVANQVTQSMQSVAQEIEAINSGLNDAKSSLADMETIKGEMRSLSQGLLAVAGVVSSPKRKPKGFQLKKDGGKTKSVVVTYDDDTSDELTVQ